MASRRKTSGFIDALNAFSGTYKTTRGVMQDKEMADISKASPEEVDNVRVATQEEAGRAQVETSAIAAQDAETFGASASDYGMGSEVVDGSKFKYLGREYNQTPTDGQKNSARLAASAGVMEKFGDPGAGIRLRAAGAQVDKSERDRAYDDELRAAMAGGVGRQINPQGGNPPGASGTGQIPNGATQRDDGLNGYLQKVAPRAIQTMMKHGNLEGAQKFQQFVESEQGRAYAGSWLSGVRRMAVGDNHGAIGEFEKMYNSQLYNDGRSVRLKPSEDGSQYVIEQFDQDGKLLGSVTKKTEDIAKQAALALEPTAAVKFMAEQEAKRASESAAMEKQQMVEGARDQREAMREDRRDVRLNRQLSAREHAPSGDRITPSQESNNLEIVAARRRLTGMSAEDVRKKTQQYTATGRTNDDFDPQLASAVRLANQRKVGDDPEFDRFNAQSPANNTGKVDRKDIAARFRADKAMNSHRLGKDTPDGIEVLDGSGKVIGHYR